MPTVASLYFEIRIVNMKWLRTIAFIIFTGALLVTSASAQQSAAEVAAGLRAQLADVQAKQSEFQARLQELDEALKPENIQNSLAGVGSTHPEDLRKQRRRQLEKEKAGVTLQLDKLAVSQRRLESAIAQAEAAAYQQSAQPPVKGPNAPEADTPAPTKPKPRRHRTRRTKVKHTG